MGRESHDLDVLKSVGGIECLAGFEIVDIVGCVCGGLLFFVFGGEEAVLLLVGQSAV